jgi:hypothetical protein
LEVEVSWTNLPAELRCVRQVVRKARGSLRSTAGYIHDRCSDYMGPDHGEVVTRLVEAALDEMRLITAHPINRHRPYCHADRDGDCSWSGCPQLEAGEPEASGRHCPLDCDATVRMASAALRG